MCRLLAYVFGSSSAHAATVCPPAPHIAIVTTSCGCPCIRVLLRACAFIVSNRPLAKRPPSGPHSPSFRLISFPALQSETLLSQIPGLFWKEERGRLRALIFVGKVQSPREFLLRVGRLPYSRLFRLFPVFKGRSPAYFQSSVSRDYVYVVGGTGYSGFA